MADTPTKPRRRWFSFSLRTLFVAVTVLACWLGYQLNWIRQRAEYIDQMTQAKRAVLTGWEAGVPKPQAPFTLRLFGEGEGVYRIFVFDETDRSTARSLFPEADVVVMAAEYRGKRFQWGGSAQER